MVRAVGYSQNEFNAAEPGRLCRGRERWIDPWPVDEDVDELHRLVVSGAAFEDDSARDALRGVEHADLDVASVIAALFPRKEFLAFTEDGHPADIPLEAEGVELYETFRTGGHDLVTGVRWVQQVSGVNNLRVLLGGTAGVEGVRGFAVLKSGVDVAELMDPIFLLTGMSNLDSPPARYQPLALPELLEKVDAIVLIHRDKHGHAVGVYSKEPIDATARLQRLCERKKVLLVPFAIPPMLARWDRALFEARAAWDAENDEPFPVPESDEPHAWDRRRRSRRKDRDEAKKARVDAARRKDDDPSDDDDDLSEDDDSEELDDETSEDTSDDDTSDDSSDLDDDLLIED